MSLAAVKSLAACALLGLHPSQMATTVTPGVFPPASSPYGLSYGEWSARWWTWFMEHPLAGHPGIDDPSFDVTSGQSGQVWFLAGVLGGAVSRTVSVPRGKALCVALLNAEFSSNEGFATEQEQRDFANFFADHIVNPACTLDGRAVAEIGDYRCESPQFSFTAPDPWIFSPAPGGAGTAVADGYFVLLRPPAVGQHTLHLTGSFHFDVGELGNEEPLDFPLDMTYVINVAP